jgi:hypothetical protein
MPRLKRVKPIYHVSSRENRESIRQHGLDWTRMTNVAKGLARSTTPEIERVFLARDFKEAERFSGFGSAGELRDIWLVDVSGLHIDWYQWHPDKAPRFLMTRKPVPPERLKLVGVRVVTALFTGRPVADDEIELISSLAHRKHSFRVPVPGRIRVAGAFVLGQRNIRPI